MTARYAPAALLAALLHAAVIVVLVWFALAARNEPGAVPKLMGPIWEVVSPSAAPTTPAPEHGIQVNIPPMPVRPKVRDEPTPMPVMKDNPPVVQPGGRVSPKPQPRPVVKPTQNPGPKVKPSATTPMQTAPVRINESGWGSPVTNRSESSPGARTGNTDQAMPELEAYWAELRQRLRAALQEPPGVPPNLVAKVEFILRADGVLLQPRILSASGSAEFDRAVLEAILRTRMGPRPDGKTGKLTFPFETELKNGR